MTSTPRGRVTLRPASRAFAALMILGAIGSSQATSADPPHVPPPSILFILVDQQRQDGVGTYGLDGVQTPHLDRLGRDGIVFTRAYVAQPVCAPNRGSLFSGLYPFRHGVRENHFVLDSAVPLLPDQLRRGGYVCGYFGKWHLGDPSRDAFDVMPSYPNDGRGKRHYYERDGQLVYQTEALADDAIAFMQKQRAMPFLCVVSMYPPHGPREVPKQYEALYQNVFPDDNSRRKYYAMGTAVDAAVGRLLKALDQLDCAENTIVVYTSEHGQLFEKRWNNHPKRLCYDEAARVPFLMRFPRRIPGGRRSDLLFNAVDMTPTLLGLAGVSTGTARCDGHDLSPLLLATEEGGAAARDAPPYTVMVNLPFIDVKKAREGSVLADAEERCIVSGQWKLILSRNRAPELYDLEADPAERDNLWRARTRGEVATRLKRQLTEWAGRVGDPLAAELVGALESRAVSRGTARYFRSDQGVAPGRSVVLPQRLDASELMWRRPLGEGCSTPCVLEERVLVTAYEKAPASERLVTVALRRHDGQVLWKRQAPSRNADSQAIEAVEAYHPVSSPASASPASDGERVYVFFGSFGLLCYDLQGEEVWRKPFEPFQDEWGAGSSPILLGDRLFLNQDHDVDSFLIAIDARSGKTLWRVERDGFTRSYATPMVWAREGREELIVAGALQLVAYDPRNGHQRWSVGGLSRIVNPTPTADADLLYAASWSPFLESGERFAMGTWAEGKALWDKNADGKLTRDEVERPVSSDFVRIDLDQSGTLDEREWNYHARTFHDAENAVLAIRPGAEGDGTPTHVVWKYERALPYVPSPLVYRGILYLVKNGGIVTSLDAKTGTVLKRGRASDAGNYYASPIAGDGKVFVASERGVVTILDAGARWDVLASRDFKERILATPVVEDDTLFVRSEKAVYAFRRR